MVFSPIITNDQTDPLDIAKFICLLTNNSERLICNFSDNLSKTINLDLTESQNLNFIISNVILSNSNDEITSSPVIYILKVSNVQEAADRTFNMEFKLNANIGLIDTSNNIKQLIVRLMGHIHLILVEGVVTKSDLSLIYISYLKSLSSNTLPKIPQLPTDSILSSTISSPAVSPTLSSSPSLNSNSFSPSNSVASSPVTKSILSPNVESKKQPTPPIWNPPLGRIHPLIHPYLLHQGVHRLITPNTPSPIPFENEVFAGHLCLLVNSRMAPMDQYFEKRFEGDKNRFEIQVQGKFRQKINGKNMFIGAEVSKKMELGLITKGVCSTIVKFCKTMNSSMHHSFGDSKNMELPHLASPFWSTMDRIIITPKGGVLPPMMIPFEEPIESRHKRKKNPHFFLDVDLDCTYSFSFKTSYMDLEQWAVVNVPLIRPMKLHTFWGDADVRFTTYYIDPTNFTEEELGFNLEKHKQDYKAKKAAMKKTPHTKVNSPSPGTADRVDIFNVEFDEESDEVGFILPKYHPQLKVKKIFSMELQHSSNHPEWANDPVKTYKEVFGDKISDNFNVNNNNSASDITAAHLPPLPSIDLATETPLEQMSSSILDDNELATESLISSPVLDEDNYCSKDETSSISSLDEDEFFDTMLENDDNLVPVTPTRSVSIPSPSTSIEFKLNKAIPHILYSLVPVIFEVDEMRPNYPSHARRILYTFSLNVGNISEILSITPVGDQSFVLHSYKEFVKAFPLVKLKKNSGNSTLAASSTISNSYLHSITQYTAPSTTTVSINTSTSNYYRLIEAEQRRVVLEQSYLALLNSINQKNNIKKLASFFSSDFHNLSFLTSNPMSQINKTSSSFISIDDIVFTSTCMLRLANTYWSQESMFLLKDGTLFFKNYSKKSHDHQGTHNHHSHCTLKISCQNILEYNFINSNQTSFKIPYCYVITIKTFGKQHEILIKGEDIKSKWDSILSNYIQPKFPYNNDETNEKNSDQASSSTGPSTSSEENLANVRNLTLHDSSFANKSLRTTSTSHSKPIPFLKKLQNLAGLQNEFTHYGNDFSQLSNNNSDLNNVNFLELLTYPKNWVLQDRYVLNTRKFTAYSTLDCLRDGNPLKTLFPITTPLRSLNPIILIEKLLEMVLKLAKFYASQETDEILNNSTSNSSSSSTPSDSAEVFKLWIDFLDGISLLQTINLNALFPHCTTSQSQSQSSPELLCMFLNLYHILLIHSYLILGKPDSAARYQLIVKRASYEAFNDVFSINELQHQIIRYSMPRPQINVLETNFFPQTNFNFSLFNTKDFRLLFALNCASESMIGSIPIYVPSKLNDQLDTVVKLSIEHSISINRSVDHYVVNLPQYILWYCRDFDPDVSGKFIIYLFIFNI